MLPDIDAFIGKNIKWDMFRENLDFLLKTYELRYTMDGVQIMRRKNVKAVHQR